MMMRRPSALAALAGVVLLLAPPRPTQAALTDAQKEAFIKCHNHQRDWGTVKPYRPTKSLGNVVWEKDLAVEAQRWASSCENWFFTTQNAPDQMTENVGSACNAGDAEGGSKYTSVGDIVAWGNSTTYSPEDACAEWAAEREKVADYDPFTCKGSRTSCFNYGQMIYENARYIGCGSNSCRGGMVYVCFYFKKGTGFTPCIGGEECNTPAAAEGVNTSDDCVWSVDGSTTPTLPESPQPPPAESASTRDGPLVLCLVLCLMLALSLALP